MSPRPSPKAPVPAPDPSDSEDDGGPEGAPAGIADMPRMSLPSLLRELPPTARGVRTRAALVAAARTIFERDGYLDARLTDITREASLATGTFYTYFDNKEQVFAAVLEEAQEEMLHPPMTEVGDKDDPVAVVEASNRAYFEAYRRNARLMSLLEQVANIDADFREMRRRRGLAFAERNGRAIADLQARGLADQTLDPFMAARALGGMVARLAYQSYVMGDEYPFDLLVETSTRLWANGLRLPQPD